MRNVSGTVVIMPPFARLLFLMRKFYIIPILHSFEFSM